MNFHTFGDKKNPAIVLIHGVLTPWQIWGEQIEHFKEKYHVIVPALDAHEEERTSEFISIEDEAAKIEDYVLDNLGGSVYAVCGISMGGAIAHIIWRGGVIGAEKFVLDGAPLVPSGGLLRWIMTHNYINIIIKSKQRDKRILNSFKKNFLPERYLGSYLKIADNMSESSVKSMIGSVCGSRLYTEADTIGAELLFIHGTKGSEMLAKRSAALMKKHYPEATVVRCEGCAHCEAAIYRPSEWIDTVENFLNK